MLAEIVRVLDLVRVYTKEPGKEADMTEPFVLRRGSTVHDVARSIHKELAESIKLARAWGTRFHAGQPVSRHTLVEEVLHHLLQLAGLDDVRHRLVDQLRRPLARAT